MGSHSQRLPGDSIAPAQPGDQVFVKEDPAAAGFGTREMAALGALAHLFGMHVEEGGGLAKRHGFHHGTPCRRLMLPSAVPARTPAQPEGQGFVQGHTAHARPWLAGGARRVNRSAAIRQSRRWCGVRSADRCCCGKRHQDRGRLLDHPEQAGHAALAAIRQHHVLRIARDEALAAADARSPDRLGVRRECHHRTPALLGWPMRGA